MLSDKNTIFLEALGGSGCLPQCYLSEAGGELGVETIGCDLQLVGMGFLAAED